MGRGNLAEGGSGRSEEQSTVIAIDSIKDLGKETMWRSLENVFGVME